MDKVDKDNVDKVDKEDNLDKVEKVDRLRQTISVYISCSRTFLELRSISDRLETFSSVTALPSIIQGGFFNWS